MVAGDNGGKKEKASVTAAGKTAYFRDKDSPVGDVKVGRKGLSSTKSGVEYGVVLKVDGQQKLQLAFKHVDEAEATPWMNKIAKRFAQGKATEQELKIMRDGLLKSQGVEVKKLACTPVAKKPAAAIGIKPAAREDPESAGDGASDGGSGEAPASDEGDDYDSEAPAGDEGGSGEAPA
eukprot:5001503-Pyramimonas_sp.AAC.1